MHTAVKGAKPSLKETVNDGILNFHIDTPGINQTGLLVKIPTWRRTTAEILMVNLVHGVTPQIKKADGNYATIIAT